jgi:hypothetical protein
MILPVFGCMNAFFEPDGDAMPGTKKVSFKVVSPFLIAESLGRYRTVLSSSLQCRPSSPT